MSRNSKAKRDARKMRHPDRMPRSTSSPIQAHAHLLDGEKTPEEYVGLREDERAAHAERKQSVAMEAGE